MYGCYKETGKNTVILAIMLFVVMAICIWGEIYS